MSQIDEIPAHIISAVDALLTPYGVSFSDVMRKSGGIQKYMTPGQAALYCGLAPKTIRDKALAGEFRSVRIGGTMRSRILIDRLDFDRWLESFASKRGTGADCQ